MWRGSFFSVRKMCDNFKSRFTFEQWNTVWFRNKKLKKINTYIWRGRWRNAVGVVYSTKTDTLQPGLEYDNFKTCHKSDISKCISWMNGWFSGGNIWVLWKVKSRPI
jgi:hypothetical protein